MDIKNLFNLQKRVIVLTGAGGMLGTTFAKALAQVNAKVVVTDSDYNSARETAGSIQDDGYEAQALALNVTNKAQHEMVLEEVLKKYDNIDVLVNCAGINFPTPFFELEAEEWQGVLDCHLTGTMYSCQVFGARMVSQGQGSIINLSSMAALTPLSKGFAYSVAKAGVSNLTQNLAREWATSGVRVNALVPGFFPTQYSKKHFIDDRRHRAIMEHTPMKRYGTPQELVGALFFLASDASSFVTGSQLVVDGGFSCQSIP